jgi:hypothetical protein
MNRRLLVVTVIATLLVSSGCGTLTTQNQWEADNRDAAKVHFFLNEFAKCQSEVTTLMTQGAGGYLPGHSPIVLDEEQKRILIRQCMDAKGVSAPDLQ